jgi:hypothetical protein
VAVPGGVVPHLIGGQAGLVLGGEALLDVPAAAGHGDELLQGGRGGPRDRAARGSPREDEGWCGGSAPGAPGRERSRLTVGCGPSRRGAGRAHRRQPSTAAMPGPEPRRPVCRLRDRGGLDRPPPPTTGQSRSTSAIRRGGLSSTAGMCSTARSAGAPTSCASSPTVTPSSASSARCWSTARRMDRRTPLPRPRRPHPLPPPPGHPHRRHQRGGDHADDHPGAQCLTQHEDHAVAVTHHAGGLDPARTRTGSHRRSLRPLPTCTVGASPSTDRR